MRIDSMNLHSINISSAGKSREVVDVEDIKLILFLGIKSDIPLTDKKRKVDIII